MTKSQAARLGGIAVAKKYGPDYMRKLGRAGQAKFKALYKWRPAGTSGWALVRRDNGAVVAFVGSLPR